VASPLDDIGGWPVAHAAAVVVDAGAGGHGADRYGDQDRPFRLASVTKLLTAVAVLVAVEEGTLDLDEPAGPPAATVRHLLAHASGLGFDTGVLTAPGQRRIYSNTGFEALGTHLAQAAGMPFADYLGLGVLEPLGMANTDLREWSPARGAWSTAADLARFAAELLHPTLISAATLATATTVQFPALDGILPGLGAQHPNDWGLGFELKDHKQPHWTGATNSPETYGHFGGTGTFLWVDPSIGRALVVLTDQDFDDWALEPWPTLSDTVVAASPRR
jgi:CubicO group peptidase (beta-lactamase class C family)